MVEPVTLAAGAIAKLAFDEFVKSGAGEVAKQSVGGAVEPVKGKRIAFSERVYAYLAKRSSLRQLRESGFSLQEVARFRSQRG